MGTISAISGFVFGGLVGWFAHVFFGDPIAEFRKTRAEGYNSILSNLDTKPLPPGSGSQPAREANRQSLAAAKKRLIEASTALKTFEASNDYLARALKGFGYNFQDAASALQNLAEHIELEHTNTDAYFDSYKKALKFPLTQTNKRKASGDF